jgi:hypothetical protein
VFWLLQIGAYETFVRRMIRRAPNAALAAVAAFNFFRRDEVYHPAAGNATVITAVPNSYYGSGGLLLHGNQFYQKEFLQPVCCSNEFLSVNMTLQTGQVIEECNNLSSRAQQLLWIRLAAAAAAAAAAWHNKIPLNHVARSCRESSQIERFLQTG